MHIIKLNATDSTNAYIKRLLKASCVKDYTIVTADKQEKGRGQMGTIWNAETGQNLTFSVFKDVKELETSHQFYISMVVAYAVFETLKHFNIPKLHIKWPNDILSGNKKLCGILIENTLRKQIITNSIIGIGLNLNQKDFKTLPNATSMYLSIGRLFDKQEVLNLLIERLKIGFKLLETKCFSEIKNNFETHLFRLNKPSTFQLPNAEQFSGIIKGVTNNGELIIWMENDIVRTYNIKQIKLLY